MNLTEDTVLAEDLLRRHGNNAAIKASDKACLKAAQGDEGDAAKWRRDGGDCRTVAPQLHAGAGAGILLKARFTINN